MFVNKNIGTVLGHRHSLKGERRLWHFLFLKNMEKVHKCISDAFMHLTERS